MWIQPCWETLNPHQNQACCPSNLATELTLCHSNTVLTPLHKRTRQVNTALLETAVAEKLPKGLLRALQWISEPVNAAALQSVTFDYMDHIIATGGREFPKGKKAFGLIMHGSTGGCHNRLFQALCIAYLLACSAPYFLPGEPRV